MNSSINLNNVILNADNFSKYVSPILALIMVLFLIPLFYSIIWYEKYGTNDKQTIVNQFFSAICWNFIAWNLSIQMLAIFRFIIGPMNIYICVFSLFTRRTLVTIALLFFDAISLVRYLFIFHLKGIASFKDDFWFQFVCLWIIGFSVILQFVNISLPGPKPLAYKVCIGQLTENVKEIPGTKIFIF